MNRKPLVSLFISIAATFLGGLALASLIWFAGPFLSWNETHPLEAPEPRLWAIGLVALFLFLMIAIRLIARARAAAALARGMSVASSDAPILAERMREALAVLKKVSGGRSRALYDLPWYILIGPPGSGKTTALVNSGLEFPLASGLTPKAVAGSGGTRYCDWWFTDDAVLIDTAGRYTTQDSDAKADQKSWLAFLRLLKRYRPRQPINGVLVAISLEDLLTLPAKEVAAHAAAIRARLIELQRHLQIEYPVYALFTKADLVIGFREYFNDFDAAARAQVFGATFQSADKAKSFLPQIPAEFDLLVSRLGKDLAARLEAEKDPASRVLAYGFPAQMAALQKPLETFLNQIFIPAERPLKASLRGFYFTSGTQEGTPIDQLLGALSRGFSAEGNAAPVLSGQGKSFFLTGLIKTLIIGEAGWVSASKTKIMARRASFAALLVLAPLCALGLWLSYTRNLDLIGEGEAAVTQIGAAAGDTGNPDVVSDHDLAKVLPELHALRYLPEAYSGPQPLLTGLGLSQRDRLQSAAESAYDNGLERLLRPRLLFRLEEQLEANADDPAFLFEALKVYLMLGDLKTLDRPLLVTWMERDWSEKLYPGPNNTQGRQELEEHLNAMLDLDQGEGPVVSLNGPLVEKVQAKLSRLNLAGYAYQRLEQKAEAALRPGWSVAKNAGAGALVVFDEGASQIQVPYFFTRDGYEHAFKDKLAGESQNLKRDRWVLGPGGESDEMSRQYDRLEPNVENLYATGYTRAWQAALGRLKLRKLTSEPPDFPLLTAASSMTSPLIQLFEQVDAETTLGGGGENGPDKVSAAVAEAMAPYRELVAGKPGGRPVDAIVSDLNVLRESLIRLAENTGGREELNERMARQLASFKGEAATLPQPFKDMMLTTAEDIDAARAETGISGALALLREQITPICEDVITGKYPFNKQALRDVSLLDFSRFFAPKGLLDVFFSENLRPEVDMSGGDWKWRETGALAKALSPQALADFQHAAEIRTAFFSADPSAPGFGALVTPPSSSGSKLEINGTVFSGKGQAGTPQALAWPGLLENNRVVLSAEPAGRSGPIEKSGLWALYRLLDAGKPNADGTAASFSLGGKELQYHFAPQQAGKPLSLAGLRSFHCPSAL